jgi:hypothetical protein
MHVKFILPALTEARGKYWRSIKYSLFPPLGLATLAGYWRSYLDFYSWRGIARSAWTKPRASGRLRHLAYVAAWKKCDPAWNLLIRLRRLHVAIPGLERVLHGWQRGPETNDPG